MEGHDAVASDQNHAAVIAAALDVVFDDGFEMAQPCGVQAVPFRSSSHSILLLAIA